MRIGANSVTLQRPTTMKKLSFLLLLGILALFVSIHASAQATRTWVSGVGDDANPCSRTAPCKTWAGAISKTSPFGEIDALDPGGFGTVTVTKSMTIDGGPNAGGISAAGSPGITINAAATDTIVIRNLYIECLGSTACTNGINVVNAKNVHVLHVDIGGAFVHGVAVSSTTTLFVDQTNVHDVTGNGIHFAPPTIAYASITNSYFENDVNGVADNDSGKMTVTNTTVAGNSNAGFLVTSNSLAATLNVINCNANFNTVAAYESVANGTATATMRLSGSTATANGVAIKTIGTTAAVLSFQNNPLTGAGLPTGTLSLQ
jgi:hypothetical protein